MASSTAKTWNRRDRRVKNAGQVRKKKEAKRSTLSAAELFGETAIRTATSAK